MCVVLGGAQAKAEKAWVGAAKRTEKEQKSWSAALHKA